MPLPGSGPLTRSQIRTEFGLSGTSVWPTDFLGKGGAPSARPLKFSDFHGLSNISSLFDLAPGNYVYDNADLVEAVINCSQSVVWTWSGPSGGDTSVAPNSGTSAVTWQADVQATDVHDIHTLPSYDDTFQDNRALYSVSCIVAGTTYNWTFDMTARGHAGNTGPYTPI